MARWTAVLAPESTSSTPSPADWQRASPTLRGRRSVRPQGSLAVAGPRRRGFSSSTSRRSCIGSCRHGLPRAITPPGSCRSRRRASQRSLGPCRRLTRLVEMPGSVKVVALRANKLSGVVDIVQPQGHDHAAFLAVSSVAISCSSNASTHAATARAWIQRRSSCSLSAVPGPAGTPGGAPGRSRRWTVRRVVRSFSTDSSGIASRS